MRRRTLARVVLAGALLASPLAALPTVAHADDSITPVYSQFGLPSDWTSNFRKCDTPIADTVHLEHITGPDAPPSGEGSLKVSLDPGEELYLEEGFPQNTDAESLSGMVAHAYQYPVTGGDTPMSATVEIDLFHAGTGTNYYALKVPLADGANWVTGGHDVYAFTNWYIPGQANSIGSGSYDSFVSNVESGNRSVVTGVTYHFRNCSGTTTQSYAIDDEVVSFGLSPSKVSTITDFEASPPTVLKGVLTKKTVAAGGSTIPEVGMSVLHESVTGSSVDLYSKPSGAANYTMIQTKTVGSNGIAVGDPVAPTVNTSYEWKYTSNGTYLDATSKPFSVKVLRNVTFFVVKKAVKVGKPLQTSGTISPKVGGLKVKLYAQKGTAKATKIGVGKTHATGFYSIHAKLPRGHYHVFTVVQKTADYAKTTSKARPFVVAK